MPNDNKRGYTDIQAVGRQVLIMLENGEYYGAAGFFRN